LPSFQAYLPYIAPYLISRGLTFRYQRDLYVFDKKKAGSDSVSAYLTLKYKASDQESLELDPEF
jgi:hypothetical protein